LYSVGLSTPKDFSFTTFDEITAEDFFRPGITSVVQPTFDMGYRAVEVLLDRIENGESAPRQKVRLPATVTVRESSSTPIALSDAKAQRSKTVVKRNESRKANR
jgi:DNA-binding LacI/PurR family transcriptional regulator